MDTISLRYRNAPSGTLCAVCSPWPVTLLSNRNRLIVPSWPAWESYSPRGATSIGWLRCIWMTLLKMYNHDSAMPICSCYPWLSCPYRITQIIVAFWPHLNLFQKILYKISAKLDSICCFVLMLWSKVMNRFRKYLKYWICISRP